MRKKRNRGEERGCERLNTEGEKKENKIVIFIVTKLLCTTIHPQCG